MRMMSARLRVAVLGATGAVGQRVVRRLIGHPWFELTTLVGSVRSAGRPYGECLHWLAPESLPEEIGRRIIQPAIEDASVDLVLSAVDAATARELEPQLVERGFSVVTNASAFRMHPSVPLLVPEVNADHLQLLGAPRNPCGAGRRGFLVANPNCATAGLALALAPLERRFGLEAVTVTTLQAVSGAGYPGAPALDILGNVIPWIAGEEEKIEREPRKILGTLAAEGVREAAFVVSAQSHRVPVVDGHLLAIAVKLARRATVGEAAAAMRSFGQPLAALELPSAPRQALRLVDEADGPQPRRDLSREGGMSVAIGRLRECPVHDLRFVALVHNTERGAAGGALLAAELLARSGYLTRAPHR